MEKEKLTLGLDFSERDNSINQQTNQINNGIINNYYIRIVQEEENLIQNENYRNLNLSREDALDRVKQLITLPDGYMTSKMVSDYFDIPESTLRTCIQVNYNELITNGLLVLRGEELKHYKEQLSLITQLSSNIDSNSIIDKRTPQLTLLTKRTVLNIAMLLRDSLVAKAVRYVILNVLETPEAQQLMLDEVYKLENRIKELEEMNKVLSLKLHGYDIQQKGLSDAICYNDFSINNPRFVQGVIDVIEKKYDIK